MGLPARIGRYRVLGVLGQGAMGIVYRGRDDTLDRDVALKVMSLGQGDREARERFAREAKAAARLQHPNIITIYEFGEHEGARFMALELLEGVDLQRAIEAGFRPDPKVTLPIVLQLLAGLGHAHDNGIVHRDVKPSNIFLPRGRPAKIMDFGVARLAGGITTAGMVVGTANYMSPEQVRAGPLDGRSDLFSAGLILYELVTGEKAYRGDTFVALMYKITHDEPDLTLLPRGGQWDKLRAVLTRALARSPDDRYPDARSMISDLELALRDLGGHPNWAVASDAGLMVRTGPRPIPVEIAAPAEPPSVPAPVVKPGFSNRKLLIGASVAAGTSLLVLAFAIFLASRAQPTASPPASVASTAATARPIGSAPPASSLATVTATTPSTAAPLPSAGAASPMPAPNGSVRAAPAPTPIPAAPSSSSSPSSANEAPAPLPADGRLERAEQFMDQRRYAAALAEAKAVLRREPNNTRAKTIAEDAELELVVESRIKAAQDALRRGDKDAAIDEIRSGLVVKPNDARLLDLWREATRD